MVAGRKFALVTAVALFLCVALGCRAIGLSGRIETTAGTADFSAEEMEVELPEPVR
jgi:hypothetical protein